MLYVVAALALLFQVTDATGTLTFKLVEYEAIGQARRDGGQSCDSGSSNNKICDPYFMICLDPQGRSQCQFLISPVFPNKATETFNDLPALVYPFETLVSWQGTEAVSSSLMFSDAPSFDGFWTMCFSAPDRNRPDYTADRRGTSYFMDQPREYEVELILRDQDVGGFGRDQSQRMGEVTHRDDVVYGTSSVTVTTTNELHRVTFEVSVHCDEYYYGDCSHYCRPSDDYTAGYYTCDADGYPVCHKGYISPHTIPPCIASSRPQCTPTNPCQNSGVCSEDGPGKFKCDCSGTGFMGPTCNDDVNECSFYACVNGGTCENTVGSFRCSCLPANTGSRCEGFLDLCAIANTCQNGATCHLEDLQQITCECPPGFSGSRCELNIDECAFTPCLNGGTCSEMDPPSFACDCPAGFSGPLCEIALSPCASNPCQNGGTCTDSGPGNFLCACTTGYSGSTCNVDVDDCASSPCANGGRCTDTLGGFVCCCLDGFNGNRCTDSRRTIDLRDLVPPGSRFASFPLGYLAYLVTRQCPQIRLISYAEVVVATAQDRICLSNIFV